MLSLLRPVTLASVSLALLLSTTHAHANDDKVVAIALSAAPVRAPSHAYLESTFGLDGRVILTPKLSIGVGYGYQTGEQHYELCGRMSECYRGFHLARVFGELHPRGGDAVVDPFVRVGAGGGVAKKGFWMDRDEGVRAFALVDARVGVSFVIARTIALGLHASGALYSAGVGYWSPLGAHVEARF